MTTPAFGLQYLLWIVPLALLVDDRRGLVYSALAGALIAWELMARPYTGHAGEIVRNLPHPGFVRAYGLGDDFRYTTIGRLALWAFFIYWWLATMVAVLRARAR